MRGGDGERPARPESQWLNILMLLDVIAHGMKKHLKAKENTDALT